MNIGCSTNDEVWREVTAALEKHRFAGYVPDESSKPAAIVTSERFTELWQAVLSRCDELKQEVPHIGSGQSAALLDWDGRGVAASLSLVREDGTDLCYQVHAYTYGRLLRLEVRTDGPWVDSHDQFWAKEAADRSNAVVIGGQHYRIEPDLPRGTPGYCAGYGGSLHRIRMLATGEVTETRNLWHQGTIPPSWRDRLPDDAEFVTAETLAASPVAAEGTPS